ncbi:hypothetical protein G7046_g2420 [Stylonectria norvegica]|nr:hypothetical protein G7046_g2420 [Stylonectria norvegica]
MGRERRLAGDLEETTHQSTAASPPPSVTVSDRWLAPDLVRLDSKSNLVLQAVQGVPSDFEGTGGSQSRDRWPRPCRRPFPPAAGSHFDSALPHQLKSLASGNNSITAHAWALHARNPLAHPLPVAAGAAAAAIGGELSPWCSRCGRCRRRRWRRCRRRLIPPASGLEHRSSSIPLHTLLASDLAFRLPNQVATVVTIASIPPRPGPRNFAGLAAS